MNNCTICGAWMMPWTAWHPDANAVCTGCAPNLEGGVDWCLVPDALQVPEEVYMLLLGPGPEHSCAT